MPPHILIAAGLIGTALSLGPVGESCELPDCPAAQEHNVRIGHLSSMRSAAREGSPLNVAPSNFVAWIDRMPDVGRRLIVEGEIAVPSRDWQVQLAPSRSCASPADVLLLELTAKPLRRTVRPGSVTVSVRYERKNASASVVKIVTDDCEGFELPITEVF